MTAPIVGLVEALALAREALTQQARVSQETARRERLEAAAERIGEQLRALRPEGRG